MNYVTKSLKKKAFLLANEKYTFLGEIIFVCTILTIRYIPNLFKIKKIVLKIKCHLIFDLYYKFI